MSKKVALACTNCSNRNYSTNITKSTESVRLEVRKFCNTCNAHTLHRETK